MYNLLFTSFPPVAIGLLDQYCTAKTRMAHPSLYRSSQEGAFFNNRIFWMWMANAIVHSVILYWLPMTAYAEGVVWDSGKNGDYLAIGNIVYTAVVITVCCKAGLEMESWSLLTHVSIWGSILFWLLFLVAYSFVWPIGLPVAPDMAGMCNLVYSTGLFWLGVVLFTFTALMPDVAFKVVRNTVYTTETEKIRIAEIMNRDVSAYVLPAAVRSGLRLTEASALLANFRRAFRRNSSQQQPQQQQQQQHPQAGEEIELRRGYAFSQEERGAISQTEFIRRYDTTRPASANSASGVGGTLKEYFLRA